MKLLFTVAISCLLLCASLLAAGPEPGVMPVLSPGDLLQVTVFNTPELTTLARLDAEGRLRMPVVGLVRLAGLDQQQAEDLLNRRLRHSYLLHPQVQILVKDYAPVAVTVLGAVQHPGVYSARWHPDLLSVVAQAGGWLQASGDTVLVTRAEHGVERTLRWNLDDLERSGRLQDPALRAGDIVRVVPAASIYVGGEVRKPGQYAMPAQGLTLLEALALAGGVKPEGVRGKTRVIHTGVSGRRAFRQVNAGRIMQGRAADVPLRPFDFVYVPSSVGRTTLVRGVETAMAAGVTIVTGVIIFH